MLNLRELRIRKGVTGQEVADAINIERSLYVRYENGSRNPPLEKLIPLAEYFGVSLGCVAGLEPIPDDFGSSLQQTDPEIQSLHPQNKIIEKQHSKPSKSKQTVNIDPDQLAALEARITQNVIDALKEDTSLLKSKDA